MFSDIVSDLIGHILHRCKPNYAYKEIYPEDDVINMLAAMHYVRLLSDARSSDGLMDSVENLKKISHQLAEEQYYDAMFEAAE